LRNASPRSGSVRYVLASFGRRGQGRTVMWFWTSVTPGADQATRSASWHSAQDRTVPVRIARLPAAVRVILAGMAMVFPSGLPTGFPEARPWRDEQGSPPPG
jgi:hypothetical protein